MNHVSRIGLFYASEKIAYTDKASESDMTVNEPQLPRRIQITPAAHRSKPLIATVAMGICTYRCLVFLYGEGLSNELGHVLSPCANHVLLITVLS